MAKVLHDEAVDGLFRDRWSEEDGKVYRVREQGNREQILAANQLARALEKRRTDGMRWALRIPDDDYVVLVKLMPELAAPDREIRDRAWRAFIVSDASRPYRIWDQAAGRGV